MASYKRDQAEGLRRLLGEPQPKILTFLSTVPPRDKNTTLINIAMSLVNSGNSVLMLDACGSVKGVSNYIPACDDKMSLVQVAGNAKKQDNVRVSIQPDLDIVTLAHSEKELKKCRAYRKKVNRALENMTQQASVVMIDVEWDDSDSFYLDIMEKGEFVLHMADDAQSIKDAYLLIKRLYHRLGRRTFNILVSGKFEKRSQLVFQNLAETAMQYLGIQLNSVGFIPQDEYIARAAGLGRSVVEAFPKAMASVAFRRIASSFSEISCSEELCEMASA